MTRAEQERVDYLEACDNAVIRAIKELRSGISREVVRELKAETSHEKRLAQKIEKARQILLRVRQDGPGAEVVFGFDSEKDADDFMALLKRDPAIKGAAKEI